MLLCLCSQLTPTGLPAHLGNADPHVDIVWPIKLLAGQVGAEGASWVRLPFPARKMNMEEPDGLRFARRVRAGQAMVLARATLALRLGKGSVLLAHAHALGLPLLPMTIDGVGLFCCG